MLTIIGTGGIGKTQLAVALGVEVASRYADDAYFVDLSAIHDADLVGPTIGRALGIRESTVHTASEALATFLRGKHLLLVLDNFEQIMDAAVLVRELLGTCRRLHILVTSREALHLPGEVVYELPALDVPAAGSLPAPVASYASVSLFVRQARTANPRFVPGEADEPVLAQVCRDLDGIPLAIELAAARVRLLPLAQIASLLGNRMRLLRGKTDAPARQQTLWNTLEWSYDLLSVPERAVLRRLAVFAGGCTLEAAEDVCAGAEVSADDMLDTLSRLADKSLLVIGEHKQAARFRMLETIREYARRKLGDGDEAAQTSVRHAQFMLGLAERAAPLLVGPDQVVWMNRLEVERDNLRAALEWFTRSGQPEPGLRLAAALWRFWGSRAYWREARMRLAQLLALTSADNSFAARRHALHAHGYFAWVCGDPADARALYVQCIAESRSAFDVWNEAYALRGLGLLDYAGSDLPAAGAAFESSLALFRSIDDPVGTSHALDGLAELMRLTQDYDHARVLLDENLALVRRIGNRQSIAVQLHNLGHVALALGDAAQAGRLLREGLAINQQLAHRRHATEDLAGLACVAAARGDYSRAARWFGAVQASLTELDLALDPTDQADAERYEARARQQVDEAEHTRLSAEGRALGLDGAVAEALAL